MNAVTLKAHYDGKQICLDEPYPLQPEAKLVVIVLPESLDEGTEAWYELGRQSLSRAYGDEEPDYSDLVGRKPPAE